jgi:SRSO17 transposase
VPAAVDFETKPMLALAQIRAACAAGVPRGVVLMDAGYGNDTGLRAAIGGLDLTYVAGIQPSTTVWAPGTAPLPAKPRSARGRPATRLRRDAEHRPIAVKALALALPTEAWQTVTWREGSADWLTSRFTRMRVRAAHRDHKLTTPRAQEWLLIEWPADEREPTKYWLATLADDIAFERLVDLAKLRWRIERDYQELKQELGLDHYEGRSWRGFHHHATLCIAAYGFLISERETIPPSASRAAAILAPPAIPTGYRPRGAADPAGAPRAQLNPDDASPPRRRTRQTTAALSVLHRPTRQYRRPAQLVTQ